MEQRITGFPPVAKEDAEILILGSMPSVKSLEASFYYAHPKNAFWHILSDLFVEPLPQTIEEKKQLLCAHRIALWDTCHSCVRPGSLDSDIRDAAVNDFAGLFARCTGIRCIAFNGKTSHALFMRHRIAVPEGCEILTLPSTSPAYTLRYEAKLAAWRAAILKEESTDIV